MKACDCRSSLTHSEVITVLAYFKSSGEFYWRNHPHVHAALRGKRAGRARLDGYRDISVQRVRILEHRLAFFYVNGRWPAEQIDHINGLRSDNRWRNLREATKSQNMQNTAGHRTRKSSSRVGVEFCANFVGKPWHAHIRVNLKRVTVGYFSSEAEAIAARISAEKTHYGEFAYSARRFK